MAIFLLFANLFLPLTMPGLTIVRVGHGLDCKPKRAQKSQEKIKLLNLWAMAKQNQFAYTAYGFLSFLVGWAVWSNGLWVTVVLACKHDDSLEMEIPLFAPHYGLVM